MTCLCHDIVVTFTQSDLELDLADKEKMRKEMEEEIRAQLMANQEMLARGEGSWDEQVSYTFN